MIWLALIFGSAVLVGLIVAGMRYGYRNGVLDATYSPYSAPVQKILEDAECN